LLADIYTISILTWRIGSSRSIAASLVLLLKAGSRGRWPVIASACVFGNYEFWRQNGDTR
jgi:hypothetical protein